MNRLFLSLLILLIIYIPLGISYVDKFYFLCPIEYKGEMIIRNDSRGDGHFLARRNGGRPHNGVDLLAEMGTPVIASRGGLVLAATSSRGMGKYVIITHAGGINTIYGHLSRIDVKKGNLVVQGQVIGAVGKTGNANHPDILPHLHFEIRRADTPQDPAAYLN